MTEMTYISPEGKSWELLGSFADGVVIEQDTIEGLVGQFEDTGVSSVAYPGQQVDFRDRKVMPLTGSFTVVVRNPDVWRAFRRSWSTQANGVLSLDFEQGPWTLPVRLASPLPFPVSVPKPGTRIQVSVIADGGLWELALMAKGTRLVTNSGDVPVWPVVRWQGAGGKMTLPSGASFVLPAVSVPHIFPLDRRFGGKAFLDDGSPVSVAVDGFSESVPVGESRQFTVPTGATLHWKIGVLDPWT